MRHVLARSSLRLPAAVRRCAAAGQLGFAQPFSAATQLTCYARHALELTPACGGAALRCSGTASSAQPLSAATQPRCCARYALARSSLRLLPVQGRAAAAQPGSLRSQSLQRCGRCCVCGHTLVAQLPRPAGHAPKRRARARQQRSVMLLHRSLAQLRLGAAQSRDAARYSGVEYAE